MRCFIWCFIRCFIRCFIWCFIRFFIWCFIFIYSISFIHFVYSISFIHFVSFRFVSFIHFVFQIVKTSIENFGIKGNQISLISPFRPQLKYLNNFKEYLIENINENELPEVSTIDKYQGKDSDFVIISLVRSNSNGNIGELLNDWKRLNVALTRAKKKLILIGSERTILENLFFKRLKDLINEKGWLIDVDLY